MKKISLKIIPVFIFALILQTTLAIGAHSAQAAITPLSLGLFPPAQFPPSDFSITGARISALWGQHRDVYGIDLGLIGNITEQTFTGIAVSGIFNYTKGQTTAIGAQIAGITNINKNKTRVLGLQAALGANINYAESSILGLQVALANVSPHTTVYGVQAGIYNKANEVYGFQIGLINQCSNLHGIQIGLLNFHDTGLIPVSPVINIGF